MGNKFNVKINKSLIFDLNQEEAIHFDVCSKSEQNFHILHNNKSFNAELVEANFLDKRYTIKINSNTYQIKIENGLDKLVQEMGYTLGLAKKMDFVIAPMPGIILDVVVKTGDKVKEGDILLVLEAMKMENALTSPKDAVIKSVSVKIGETVEKNKLLIEFE